MKYTFAIIGSGWRSEFFIRCARQLPKQLDLCALASRNGQRREEYRERLGIDVYENYQQLLSEKNPDFVVVSVAEPAMAEVSLGILKLGVPVLAETHPMATEELIAFYKEMPPNAKFQVAEQYWLQPYHQAVLAFLKTGKIGEVVEARISFTQTYHAISLMRKYLGITFENAKISARRFEVPGYPGFGRSGVPMKEELVVAPHTMGFFEFGKKTGIYDFEANQHRSWIRSANIVAKGIKGQIENQHIVYLKDYLTPVESAFLRKNKGELINMEGCGLKGYQADGEWLYQNPFPEARFTDEEIAIAKCLLLMGEYAHGGDSFYSFSEAAQDCYLEYVMEQAVKTGETLETKTQIWARDN